MLYDEHQAELINIKSKNDNKTRTKTIMWHVHIIWCSISETKLAVNTLGY